MRNFLSKYKYQLLLFLITAVLFVANYRPGSYLLGWDSLSTEFNPGLAVKRAFFSAWEEYQSFGLTAGMAHAADLPRAVFLWIASFFVPQNMIRYFYHFLMLFLGGLGMMRLLRKESHTGGDTPGVSFLGALFYMLNLGIVQIFYVPFEAFSTFFAFLPWSVWSFITLLRSNDKKAWLLFFLINLLGTPSFYTQQLFVVYILVLACFSIPFLLQYRNNSRAAVTKLLLIFTTIFLINSFWILPQLYFLKTNGDWVGQAKANQIVTEDTLYQNLSKGTFDNFLRLEGFYFDLKGIHNTPLFAPWQDHFKGIFGVLPYLFAGLGILGFLSVILTLSETKWKDLAKRKDAAFGLDSSPDQVGIGMTLVGLLCTLALLSATPPFSWLNTLLRENSFIKQVFRSPFTKFIIPFSFVYSYFVAKGTYIIRSDLKKYVLPVFFILIILYSLPSFKGYFISSEMKVKIPSDYFQVMNYFKQEDKSKRIALLPDYTFWGWFFTKWGYNGSGFFWYGIEQPIVSRTFDVWSPKSESYFWEQKQALEAENLTKYEAVLEKYNVDYLILDYSLIPVVSSYKTLSIDRIEGLLGQSQKINLVFRGENLVLYQVSHLKKIENFISLSSGLNSIGPKVKSTAQDKAFQENGDYILDNQYDLYYPFADLTTQTRIKKKNWQLKELINSFLLISDVNFDLKDYQLDIASTSAASIFDNQTTNNLKLNFVSSLENKKIKVNFEKLLIKSFDVSSFNNKLQEFSLTAPELPQKYGYLIKIRSKNIKGSPLFFYVIDNTKKQSMIEEKLRNNNEYFILPNKFDYGLGYTLVFQNKSYKNYPSENLLEEVSIYLFPYKELKEVKFVNNQANLSSLKFSKDFTTKKINYFTYKVIIDNETMKQSNNLILYQAYEPGWIAFANRKILPHVFVNNWANGWYLDNQLLTTHSSLITIIFWPQYLEFLGLALLIVAFLIILRLPESISREKAS